MKNHTQALLGTLLAALLWSTAGMFVKLIDWEPVPMAGGRSLAAALVLLPAVFRIWEKDAKTKQKSDHIQHGNPTDVIASKRGKQSWMSMQNIALFGAALSYAAFNFCFVLATKLTTSANAILLQYTAPIYVALLGYFFLKEPISRSDILCMGVVALGMGLFFLDSSSSGNVPVTAPIGNLFGIGSGISFASMVLFLRLQKNREGSQVLSMFYGCLITAGLSLPAILRAPAPSLQSLLGLAATGCIVGISYGIYAAATQGLSALEAVLVPVIDPVLNPVWVYLTVGERPGNLALLGGAVVITAILAKSVTDMVKT